MRKSRVRGDDSGFFCCVGVVNDTMDSTGIIVKIRDGDCHRCTY